MEAVVFFVSAAVVLVGAAGVIVMRNPVHAALSLVMTLFGVAVLFIDLEAYFLAAVQVIVYAGAIVVLFLFVIMLLGVDRADDVRTEPIMGQRQFAALAGAGMIALAVVIGIGVSGGITGTAAGAKYPASEAVRTGDGFTVPPEDNIRELARVLFTDYVFVFEITGLLLTIAVVAAVMLSRRPAGHLQPIPDVEPPWLLVSRPDRDGDVVTDDDLAEADGADLLADGEPESEEVRG